MFTNNGDSFRSLGVPALALQQLDDIWSFIITNVHQLVNNKADNDAKANITLTPTSKSFLPLFNLTSSIPCTAYGDHIPTEAPSRPSVTSTWVSHSIDPLLPRASTPSANSVEGSRTVAMTKDISSLPSDPDLKSNDDDDDKEDVKQEVDLDKESFQRSGVEPMLLRPSALGRIRSDLLPSLCGEVDRKLEDHKLLKGILFPSFACVMSLF
jgi:hypothetical protein